MFVDCHLHVRIKEGLPRNSAGDNYTTPEQLIAMMDGTGVERGVLLPGVSPECRKQITPPEDILEVVERHPDRFFAFCNLDPRSLSNSPDADLDRALLYYKERGCRGVGEICANMHFDDPYVLNLFRHCEACEMPVLFHIGPRAGGCYGLIDELHLPRLEKCLKLFPRLVFIGHSQPFWSEISADVSDTNRNTYPDGKVAVGGALPRLLDNYRNLYADISAGSGYNALTRDPEFGYDFMEKYRERLFFGTDIASPKNDHRHAELLRNSLKEGKISQEAFEGITWKNINEVLKLGL